VGWYGKFVVPRLIDLAMRGKVTSARRAELVPGAGGVVLEIGVGSGLNLPFYSPAVTRLHAVDPSPELLAMARRKLARLAFPAELRLEGAEQLSLDRESVDTIVMTWTLCSIPDPARALREMRRVLKPQGRMLFVEHGLAPDASVRAWQNRLQPFWGKFAGGCHLDRRIDELLTGAGFRIAELRTAYLPGPRPFTYTYEGCAVH